MKLVFFSSDELEVERVSLALAAASIACEVRKGTSLRGKFYHLPEMEVWIRKDADLSRAFMVCIQQNLGLARREMDSAESDFLYAAAAA